MLSIVYIFLPQSHVPFSHDPRVNTQYCTLDTPSLIAVQKRPNKLTNLRKSMTSLALVGSKSKFLGCLLACS